MDFIYLTKEGLQRLKKELHDIKFKQRPVVSQKIASAREHGDLKENAEYHAAREELSLLETKVHQLQDKIARARIIDENNITTEEVSILNTVKVEDLRRNKHYEYTLVSAEEADIKQNKISVASPVGKGLLGKKVGDVIDIPVPAGILEYKIISITR